MHTKISCFYSKCSKSTQHWLQSTLHLWRDVTVTQQNVHQ